GPRRGDGRRRGGGGRGQ
nr:Chain B, Fragile X mental retardation 1 protein [Homo sapiens]